MCCGLHLDEPPKPHVVMGGRAFQRWLNLDFVNGSWYNARINSVSAIPTPCQVTRIQYKRQKESSFLLLLVSSVCHELLPHCHGPPCLGASQ